jgi:hypothetical protein
VLLALVSCAEGPTDVPAGCEVMSDPAACAPGTVRHVELLAPGARPATETARYCGAVIKLANALQLYIDDPPDRHELLAGVEEVQRGNDGLAYDPAACA